jgi:hypothetical protein
MQRSKLFLAIMMILFGGALALAGRMSVSEFPLQTELEIDVEKGLVAYWKFDEGEGDIAFDHSTNYYDITLGDSVIKCTAPKYVREMGGIALYFDGQSSCAQPIDFVVFFENLPFTVTAWINSREPNGEWSRIFSQEFLNEDGWQGWRIYRHAYQNLIGFNRMRDGNGVAIYSPFAPNKWHFFAFSYDGLERKIYRDGILMASIESKEKIVKHETPLVIARFSKHTQDFWEGMLREVRIWSRALTEAEIRSYMSTLNE